MTVQNSNAAVFAAQAVNDSYFFTGGNLTALDVLDNDLLNGAELASVGALLDADGEEAGTELKVTGNAVAIDICALDEGTYTFTYTIETSVVPTESVASGDNILSNGSFEQGCYQFNCYGSDFTSGLNGWTVSGLAQAKILSKANKTAASDGNIYLELDAKSGVDAISQTVSGLDAGDSYQLSLDLLAERCVSAASQKMKVIWNGEVAAVLTADQASWTEHVIELVAQGDNNTLELREAGSGNDGNGILLDNLSLEKMVEVPAVSDENMVVNGSFEQGNLQFNCYGQAIGTQLAGWDVIGEYQVNRGTCTDSDGASDGRNYAELDANNHVDGLSQSFETLQAGSTYQLQFDMQGRDAARDSQKMKIFWNGTLIDVVNATETDWTTYKLDVVATEGANTLTFKEAGNENNRFGVLLDDIGLYQVLDPVVQSSSATVTITVDRPEVKADVINVDLYNGIPTKAVVLDVLANDDDPAGGGLTITNVTQQPGFESGTYVVADDGQSILFQPDPEYFDELVADERTLNVFSYTFIDADGNEATGHSAVHLNGNLDAAEFPEDLNLMEGQVAYVDDVRVDDFDDVLSGTAGNDIVAAYDGDDVVFGQNGNDYIFGEGGDDEVSGGRGDDELSGGEGNDTLSGDQGDDLVDGDNGDDVIIGGAGDDVLYGDDGADTFVFASGHGNDVIKDFEDGSDLIDVSGLGIGTFSDLSISANAVGDAVVDAGNVSIVLETVNPALLDGEDFVFLV